MLTYLILTADDKSIYSNMITRISDGYYSHAALAFIGQQTNDRLLCFENSWRPHGNGESGGLRGPYPFQEHADWWKRDPDHRRLFLQRIPLDRDDTEAAYEFMTNNTDQITYSPLNVASAGIELITGIEIGHIATDPKSWTCSETIVRAMPPAHQVKFYNIGNCLYRYVVPSGEKLPSCQHAARLQHVAAREAAYYHSAENIPLYLQRAEFRAAWDSLPQSWKY